MNAGAVAAHLEGLGMAPDDAASRAALADTSVRGLHRLEGAAPEWLWWVPGRLEIFGKHVDYAGGRSLLAAVPRGFVVAARSRPDAIVRVHDAKHGQTVVVRLDAAGAPATGWGRYVEAVARRLASNFEGAPLGLDVAFASDLPRAAGLSSSSALVVGLGLVLVERGALAHRERWAANVTSPLDLAWYLGCVESGHGFRGLRGTSGVGTLGGSEDHTAILTCRAGHVSHVGFVPSVLLGEYRMPDEWTFVVASSGVHAAKAGGVREAYNRMARAAHAIAELWSADGHGPAPASLRAVLASAPDASARLKQLIAERRTDGMSAAMLTARLEHFEREDARAGLAAQALATRDRAALSRLSEASQREAEDLLGNQVAETRALAAAALTAGAFGASSFGAGFGGSVWALVAAGDAARFAPAWLAAYQAAAPQAAGTDWFVARPGPAASRLPVRA